MKNDPILIDANSLLVLILGMMDPSLISSHKRTSVYEKQDYDKLLSLIGDIENLVVLPNVWTEVDNLLNDFNRERKILYLDTIKEAINVIQEEYIPTINVTTEYAFIDLGITDTLLLQCSLKYQLLITSDSKLSDYARANSVAVHDMKEYRNKRFKK